MEIMSVYFRRKYVIFCAIWYHFYKVKNVKNTHGGVALLVKLQAKACNFTIKVALSMGVFHVFSIVQIAPNRAKHHLYKVHLLTGSYQEFLP